MRTNLIANIVGLLSAVIISTPCFSSTSKQVTEALNKLRNIKPTNDKAALEVLNANMDSIWKMALKDPTVSTPIVEKEVKAEVDKQKDVDHFFVMDAGYLLFTLKNHDKKKPEDFVIPDLILKAVSKIDPEQQIIQYNQQELFDYIHALAKTGNSSVQGEIDRLYLKNKEELNYFKAPHVVRLDPVAQYVMLRGASSIKVDEELAVLLDSPIDIKSKIRIAEALTWLGSEHISESVYKVIIHEKDPDIISRLINSLLRLGGPKGKTLILKLENEASLDAKNKKSLQSIFSDAKKLDFKFFESILEGQGIPRKHLKDQELKKQLEKMYANYGVDVETDPLNVIRSGLSKDYLLEMMKKIRQKTLFRANNHAFDDLKMTNFIINCIQFK